MSKRFSLGRADAGKADILLSGSAISARHAELHIDNNGTLLISDTGSSNGTKIHRGNIKLDVSSQLVPLRSSDLLSFGGKTFTVAELLAKLPREGRVDPVRASTPKAAFSGKMMRCSACGSVTPQGKACIECGHHA
jgi:pSer/pThr/pTyr-binding forkhead associated (FHA) protein